MKEKEMNILQNLISLFTHPTEPQSCPCGCQVLENGELVEKYRCSATMGDPKVRNQDYMSLTKRKGRKRTRSFMRGKK